MKQKIFNTLVIIAVSCAVIFITLVNLSYGSIVGAFNFFKELK